MVLTGCLGQRAVRCAMLVLGDRALPETNAQILAEIEGLRQQIDKLHALVARQAIEETVPTGAFDGVVCRIAGEHFALPLDVVERAEMMCSLVAFPEAPPWVPGLLNLHGELVTVLDAAARIARTGRDLDPDDFIVVCHSGQGRIGLVVQEVCGLRRFASERVRPVPPELPQAPYVVGVVEGDGPPVFLMSLACLRTASEVPERKG